MQLLLQKMLTSLNYKEKVDRKLVKQIIQILHIGKIEQFRKDQFEATDPLESGSCYGHLGHYAIYKLTNAREIEDLSNKQEIWKEPKAAFTIATLPK